MTNQPVSGPTILLRSGVYFDFLDPARTRLRVTDIAHALSHLCRFSGHVRKFYSVAEHSVLCSMIVPPEYALEALLHDAVEAVLGDVAAPLKMLLPDYQRLEHRIETVLRAQLGQPPAKSKTVKAADLAMLAMEKVHVMGCNDQWGMLNGVGPADITPIFLPPEQARLMFLSRYNQLVDGE